MWKKDDLPTAANTPEAERTPRFEPTIGSSQPARGERAGIGRSITIVGDVTGDEDLLIQGRVDGSINLKQHAVTIGSDGEVKASIVGRVVIVEGRVEGNISSEEQVVLRSTARVQGDITAPRLVLEDGARFRGGVDMGEDPITDSPSAKSAQSDRNRASGAAPGGAGSGAAAKEGDNAAEANGAKRKGAPEVAEARA